MSPSHLDNPPGATKGGASERESSPSSYDAEPRATSELTGLSSSSLEHEDTSGEQSPVEDSFDESTSAVAADAIGPIPVGSLYAYTESKKSLSFQDQLLSSTPSEFPKVTLSDAALSGAVDEASNSQLQKYSPETNGDVPSIDLAAPVGATKSSPDVNPALRKSASSGDLQEETEANLQEIPEVFLAALSSTDEKRVESSCYQELPESTEAAESGNDGTFAKTPRTLPNIRRNNRAALSSAISIHDEREFSHEDESPRRSVSSDGEMSSLGKRMRTLSRTSEEKQASLQKGKALPSGSAGATSVLLGGEGSESKNEMARFPQNEKAESSLLSSLVNGRALEPHGQSTITAPNIALAIEDPFSLAETQVLFPVAMANGLMHSSPLKLTHDPQQLLETPATARGPDATVQAEAKQALIALGAHAPMMSDTEKHFNLVGARSGDPDELESDHTLLVVIATGDRTASEKAFLNTQVGVSTSGATVISSSSSRRVPVTAVTAVTADSSPSLPRDTVEDRLASPRREQQRRMFPAVNDTNTADESLVSIHTVERPVDLHSITESVLAASACIADEPSWDDSAETLPQQQQSVVDTLDVTAHHQATPGDASRRPATTYRKIRQRPCTGNCPVRLHAHLKERYVVAPIMIFHLADDPPDDLTMTTFERQLVHIAWKSPGQTVMSETPSVATLLRFCYALSAWLHSESSGVASLSSIRSRHSNSPIAIVCCANGKTRTAIAISCYLKYAGIVDNVQSGFCHFLMRRCYADQSTVSPEQVLSDLPASLRTFFRNFDTAIELGEYINRKPLLLKAIAVQGVPVEDRPCLDVWDASGHHVYSSHPYVWSDLKETTVYTSNQAIAQTERTRHSAASQWADEEGFFRVNCLLQGDFCILCRFGGPYAKDVTDTSKILFRYANSTAFMGAASPYELPCSRVDLQRRYADHFEEDDFLLSLMFDAHWSASNKLEKAVLRRDCPETILPDILTGAEAMEAGWHEIVRFHLARPSEQDVDQLIIDSVGELDGCPRHIASLALQLANFDSTMAQTILLEGRLRYWWQEQQDDSSTGVNDEYHLTSQTILDSLESFGHTEALDKIQSLLETLDSTASYSSRDLLLREPQELSKCEITCVEPPNSGVNIVGRGTAVKSSILYQSPIMVPHPGAVMSTLSSLRASTLFRTTGKSFMGEYPQFPVVPRRLKRGKSIPIEDLDNDAAMEMFLKLDHPGVCLMGLLDMATKSCRINDSVSQLSLENHVAESTTATAIFDGEVMLMAELASPPSEPIGKRLPSGHSVGPLPAIVSGAGSAAAVIAKIVALKQSPALSAEAAMTNINNSGQPSGAEGAASALAQQEGPVIFGGTTVATSNDRDGTSGASAAAATVMAKQQTLPISTGAEAAAERNSQGGSAGAGAASSTIAERQGPAFSAGAAAAAMARRNNLGGLTGAAAAARENTTEKPAIDSVGEPSLKDDSKYQKYFKMLEMGLPDGAVRNAMQRDDVDPWILDLDPKKSLSSQKNISAGGAGDLDIKNNPRFQKYFKMLKMGLSKGAVCNAMQRDDLDPSILDVDQEERSNTQKTKDVANGGLDPDNGPSIKVDLAHQKYIKMRAMGLPEGAVLNAMMRDGVDPSKLDHDLEESSQSQRDAGDPAADGFSTKYDPAYEKYYKMLKMGLPDGAVRNAMERDGVDASLFYSDPKMSLNSQTKEQDRDNGVPIKDDPEFEKYFKMLKMGLPEGAVRNAMERDGVDSSVLDLNREKSLNFQRGAASDDEGVPLKEDPEWSKYFKMIQMGLPMGAVKNAVDRDGKDPSVLDLDPFKSMASQTKLEVKGRSQQPLKKKKRVRRKKIYWNPLNSGQIKANSLWSHVKGRLQMSQLKYDEKEFADLFTESADPTDTTKKIQMRDSSKAKKSVQVIDGKRSMNGGIILARLKVNYKKIAEMVDSMHTGKLDSTSLKALKEMLPTADEKGGLLAYMRKCGSSSEANDKAYSELSECEKYMYTMLDVSDAAAKFECMLFRSQFKTRCEDFLESIESIEKACDEVRSSERLQTIMAMILTLVNEINTGGDGNEAAGFTLDALLKLNEAKAFDKKTSVLHYLVKLMKQNDESLLRVRDDLGHVKDAELVVLDSLCADIKALKDEIEPVRVTVTAEAQRLEEAGQLVQLSLKELSEQRTSVRTIASVPQYNKIDHHTGRTPMERFVLNAASRIDEALAFTDKVKEKFAKLLEYFGEDGNMASNDFFGTMNQFLGDFAKAVEQIDIEDKAKAKEETKKAKQAEKHIIGGSKSGKKDTASERKQASKGLHNPGTATVERAAAAKTTSTIPPSASGIAVMTAATAAKRENEAFTKTSKISAIVAAKNKKKLDKGSMVSGIAAMAAAAAAEKRKPSGVSPSMVSGIAAMAAAAAAEKNKLSGLSPSNISGIAAMAAATAAEKNKSSGVSPSMVSGIAAMAAAAAAEKNKSIVVSPSMVSGIAAMAAAAAAEKNKPNGVSPVSGIAEAAAALNNAGEGSLPLFVTATTARALAAHSSDVATTVFTASAASKTNEEKFPTSIARLDAARSNPGVKVTPSGVAGMATASGVTTSVSGLAALAMAAASAQHNAAKTKSGGHDGGSSIPSATSGSAAIAVALNNAIKTIDEEDEGAAFDNAKPSRTPNHDNQAVCSDHSDAATAAVSLVSMGSGFARGPVEVNENKRKSSEQSSSTIFDKAQRATNEYSAKAKSFEFGIKTYVPASLNEQGGKDDTNDGNSNVSNIYFLPKRAMNQNDRWIATVSSAIADSRESETVAIKSEDASSITSEDFEVGGSPASKKDSQGEWLSAIALYVQNQK